MLFYSFLLFLSFRAQASRDTIRVYFDIAVPELDETAEQAIDSAVYFDILHPGMKIGIIGYADYLGSEQANITLSENRAKNVQEYLETLGIDAADIEIVTGKGEVKRNIENGDAGYREDRRVDIVPGGFVKKTDTAVTTSSAKKTAPLIDLSKVKENETIRLEKIFFQPGRHFLREESTVELLKLYKIMADNPTLKISIEGHICCLLNNTTDGYDYDTEEFNLSENRAAYIYNYLVYKGIGKDRMQYKGFGKTRPLVDPERTPEDENMNRRVEIRILSK